MEEQSEDIKSARLLKCLQCSHIYRELIAASFVFLSKVAVKWGR